MSEEDKSILSLADYKDKDAKERKEFFLEQIEKLKKSIEDDDLTSFLVEYEREIEHDGETATEGTMIFWNDQNSIDLAISKCERIKNRLILLVEGIIGGD